MEDFAVRPEQSLALAHAPAHHKRPFALILCLDSNLALVANRGQEPILKQLRLAWWREQISTSAAARSKSDPLLAALSETEQGQPDLNLSEIAMMLVVAWNELVTAEDGDVESGIDRCAALRGNAIFGGFARWRQVDAQVERRSKVVGANWARQTLGMPAQGRIDRLPHALKALNLLEMTARFGCRKSAFARFAGIVRVYSYALTNL